MTIPREINQPAHLAEARTQCSEPVSLEAIAVVEQLLAQMLGELRQKLARSAAHDGAIEYASWLPQRRQPNRPAS